MRGIPTALFVAMAIAASGCGDDDGVPSVIQWIDGTGSAAGASIELCTKHARDVTRAAAAQNAIVAVERLDADTANAPTFQNEDEFETPAEIAADPEMIEKEHEDAVDALYTAAAPVLSADAAGHTEVVGALAASGRRLRSHDGPRFIHVCSDLLDRRLLALDRLDQASVEKLLAEMARAGDIPRLHGAKVAFDTTSMQALDELGPPEQAAMEWFYESLVEKGGGELVGYGPGVGLPLD